MQIASTYEIIEHIGAGGGGDVYLARHVRLNKLVVLKADKRKITTEIELLRREVDVMKDLTHTYIPKVYDFFVENDIVYTAMDYIEGESLDKPLKRGERFSQAQVIEWGRQLLEALSYLHAPIHGNPPRGFVHSDIKPANLMRTPNNTICLIDFNIALALGEESFVGCSAGYASPEHYGLDYTTGFTPIDGNSRVTGISRLTRGGRSRNTQTASKPVTSPSGRKKVTPDVRSDIFSAGATLYHLLSGQRPANNALEVVRLSDKEFSPQLVEIIAKAMSPNPEFRYQTADEMLYDLNHLHENDPRVKRARRRMIIAESGMAALLALGVCTSFVGLKRTQAAESALKFAEYSRTAMADGDTAAATDYALRALPKKSLLTPAPAASAECALADALQVYSLSDGYKNYRTVDLSTIPQTVSLSPDGKTFACICLGQLKIGDTDSAVITARLGAEKSALSDVVFVGNDLLLYASDSGIKAYDIAGQNELWTGAEATSIAVSMDGKTAAAVYKDNSFAVIYDVSTGSERARIDFGGRKQSTAANDIFMNPHNNLLALSPDGTKLAVSFEDGTLSVFSTDDPADEWRILAEPNSFIHFEGGFYKEYLAFSAADETGSVFVVMDAEKREQTNGIQDSGLYSVKTDADGIYLQEDNLLVKIDPVTFDETPLVSSSEVIRGYDVENGRTVISSDNALSFFNENARLLSDSVISSPSDFLCISENTVLSGSTNSSVIRILKYEDNRSTELFSYDPACEHDEARISADRKTVMLFRYNKFSVFGMDGTLINETEIPDAENVYDQQYIKSGTDSVLEVTYYSGKVLVYSGADGALLREEQRDPPDDTLFEEFYTDNYRIVSTLHGAPTIYDKQTGKLVAEIDEDAYLTYVTQQGEYILAQFITTDGRYYGTLLNSRCEKLATLPYMCDISEGKVVFDYPTGKLRETRIYKLDELLSMARQ